MQLECYLPFWDGLPQEQQNLLRKTASEKYYQKGMLLHRGSDGCDGLLIVKSGLLRVYIVSEEGKELTLYRLLERDICLLSASCMMSNIQFDVTVAAEQDACVLYIPADEYKKLMHGSLAVSDYTNQLMASRFSDVMWLMDQVMNKKLDSRLAALLLEERELSGGDVLYITHEQLGNHLGSMREVVTRMLKYFQEEGLVRLRRGSIQLLQTERLYSLAGASLR